jgi:hypothetical protein
LFHGPKAVYIALAVIVSILSDHHDLAHPPARPRQPDLSPNRMNVVAGAKTDHQPAHSPRRLSVSSLQKKVILGARSRSTCSPCCLGGAVALLPIYAQRPFSTLARGDSACSAALPESAPTLTAIAVAHYGPSAATPVSTMLSCVAAFGVFTIAFGISHSLILSLIALLSYSEPADMVSVIIRATLIQVATLDEMRGRVNAVDMLFIGVSNELGEFESGLTAQWFGTVPGRNRRRSRHTW